MTDHAAAPAADTDTGRDARPANAPGEASVPDAAGALAPKLRMVGAADAPACDGDGCVVPFAANPVADAGDTREGTPE